MKISTALFRDHLPLVVIGFCSELVYLFYFVLQFPLLRWYRLDVDMGQITGHSVSGFVTFVAMFILLFGLFAFAWRHVTVSTELAPLWLVLGFGAVFAVTLTFVYPGTAIDLFAYTSYGRILTHFHQNPILVPPGSFPHDPIMARADGWMSLGAPYGPLGILVLALPSLVTGTNVLLNVVLLKLTFSVLLLGTAFLAYLTLRPRNPRLALPAALFVAWNPYLLFETSANGHIDIVMAFFLMLGVWALAERDTTSALVLVVVSALVKYVTVLLIPLFLIHGVLQESTWRGRFRYLLVAGGISVAVIVVSYAPFWGGMDTVLWVVRFQNQRYIYSFCNVLSNVLLHTPCAGSDATIRGGGAGLSLQLGPLLGRLLFLPFFAYAFWLATRGWESLLRGCFLTLFFYLVFANSGFLYWYSVTIVVLAGSIPDFPYRFLAFLSACAIELVTVTFNIYVWVWVGVNNQTFAWITNISYVAMFVVPILLVAGLMWARRVPALRHRLPLGGAPPLAHAQPEP